MPCCFFPPSVVLISFTCHWLVSCIIGPGVFLPALRVQLVVVLLSVAIHPLRSCVYSVCTLFSFCIFAPACFLCVFFTTCHFISYLSLLTLFFPTRLLPERLALGSSLFSHMTDVDLDQNQVNVVWTGKLLSLKCFVACETVARELRRCLRINLDEYFLVSFSLYFCALISTKDGHSCHTLT